MNRPFILQFSAPIQAAGQEAGVGSLELGDSLQLFAVRLASVLGGRTTVRMSTVSVFKSRSKSEWQKTGNLGPAGLYSTSDWGAAARGRGTGYRGQGGRTWDGMPSLPNRGSLVAGVGDRSRQTVLAARGFLGFVFVCGVDANVSRCRSVVCILSAQEKLDFWRQNDGFAPCFQCSGLVLPSEAAIATCETGIGFVSWCLVAGGLVTAAQACFANREQLDFWHTLGKHDSLLQKSPLVSHLGGDRLGKTRRFLIPRVPKGFEFALMG